MTVLLTLLLILCGLPLGYSYLLLFASLRKPPDLGAAKELRFAVAIPAHNEEPVIEATIRGLRESDYPSHLIEIFVAADNCTDETASIARAQGARVYVRETQERGGKGPTLSWLFERIFETGMDFDAIVVFDADTRVHPNFFRAMCSRLSSGSQIVQGNHVIRNPHQGWFPALTWAMFLIDNRCQNLGRANLGLSAKNMGDSICFKPGILKWMGWGKGLTEDYAFRQKLLLKGLRIDYEPRAVGFGEAAADWKEARQQRARWLSGTYQSSRKTGRRLLIEGLRRRDFALLDGALQAYFPSYSTLTLLVGILTVFSWTFERWSISPLPIGWTCLFGMAFIYPLLALVFERAPLRAFLVILTGPVFIIWRTAVTISSRFMHREVAWVRTPRHMG
jgi:cellulose synthase/poly-beta-1,6-N-acetylglucosamine synthase-like glycosyltransferase